MWKILTKFFDFKPEILIDFNWTYITGFMTDRRFHQNREILVKFNTCLAWLYSIKILLETKL